MGDSGIKMSTKVKPSVRSTLNISPDFTIEGKENVIPTKRSVITTNNMAKVSPTKTSTIDYSPCGSDIKKTVKTLPTKRIDLGTAAPGVSKNVKVKPTRTEELDIGC